jgi:hypothetical protein
LSFLSSHISSHSLLCLGITSMGFYGREEVWEEGTTKKYRAHTVKRLKFHRSHLLSSFFSKLEPVSLVQFARAERERTTLCYVTRQLNYFNCSIINSDAIYTESEVGERVERETSLRLRILQVSSWNVCHHHERKREKNCDISSRF